MFIIKPLNLKYILFNPLSDPNYNLETKHTSCHPSNNNNVKSAACWKLQVN